MRRKASAPSCRSARRAGRIVDEERCGAHGTFGRRPRRGRRAPVNNPMDHDSYPDSYIRGILNTVKSIAMVGISPKDNRPSYFAFKYLMERGYRMIPVNPGQAGHDILGQKVYAKLADIPELVDMIDIFRAPQFALGI